jgi:hypothetical protein
MKRALYPGLSLAGLALSATAASAHPGDHTGFGWNSLAAHLFEPDHLVFIALIVLVGLLGYRLARWTERRVRERSRP